MISASNTTNSEKALMRSLHTLADAGVAVIQVRTREPIRAAVVCRKNLIGSDTPYKEWDITNGFRTFTRENYADHQVTGDNVDFLQALKKPLEDLRNPTSNVRDKNNKIHYFVYLDPHPFIPDNPLVIEMLQQYASLLPSTNVCMLLITPEVTLSDLPAGTVLVADMNTPTAEELRASLDGILQGARDDTKSLPKGVKITPEQMDRLANLGLGLSLFEMETFAAISIIKAREAGEKCLEFPRLMEGIADGKTEVVKQSEILELTHSEDIGNVGGMGRLKDWLSARAGCYTDDAKAWGIEAPKGMMVCGVPGTGKSLIAKAASGVFEVPLVRLDIGRVFSKFVGDSEQRMRSALKMIEGMAPVVLFVDEIDKGLGGAGNGGDAGTSMRVLGSFLTWLQECKAAVFTVVTANRVDGLPPELLRRGRFDQVFSVGMPNVDERQEVLGIHLRKRGRELSDFSEADLLDFAKASDGYVPAEIESAVKDALIASFNDAKAKQLEMKHILTALEEMVPMSKSHKEAIERMTAWAASNATPVSYPVAPTVAPSAGARIIRAGRR